jgi:hypothetical protein
MVKQIKSWTSPTEEIVSEVKKLYSQDKWDREIKARIKASIPKPQRPEPENKAIFVDDYNRATADKICAAHYSSTGGKVLISQFVRSKSLLKSVEICIKTGTVSKTFDKGPIIGALVGFRIGDLVILGWSAYNRNHENLPFTKKDAIRVAVIRGLADSLIDVSKTMWKTTSGIQIPKDIAAELPDFVKRINRYYYNRPIANLTLYPA